MRPVSGRELPRGLRVGEPGGEPRRVTPDEWASLVAVNRAGDVPEGTPTLYWHPGMDDWKPIAESNLAPVVTREVPIPDLGPEPLAEPAAEPVPEPEPEPVPEPEPEPELASEPAQPSPDRGAGLGAEPPQPPEVTSTDETRMMTLEELERAARESSRAAAGPQGSQPPPPEPVVPPPPEPVIPPPPVSEPAVPAPPPPVADPVEPSFPDDLLVSIPGGEARPVEEEEWRRLWALNRKAEGGRPGTPSLYWRPGMEGWEPISSAEPFGADALGADAEAAAASEAKAGLPEWLLVTEPGGEPLQPTEEEWRSLLALNRRAATGPGGLPPGTPSLYWHPGMGDEWKPIAEAEDFLGDPPSPADAPSDPPPDPPAEPPRPAAPSPTAPTVRVETPTEPEEAPTPTGMPEGLRVARFGGEPRTVSLEEWERLQVWNRRPDMPADLPTHFWCPGMWRWERIARAGRRIEELRLLPNHPPKLREEDEDAAEADWKAKVRTILRDYGEMIDPRRLWIDLKGIYRKEKEGGFTGLRWFLTLQLVPVLGTVINRGWRIELMRGDREGLPSIAGIGRHLSVGMMLWAFYLVYLIPFFLILALNDFAWIEALLGLAWWLLQTLSGAEPARTLTEVVGGSFFRYLLESVIVLAYPVLSWPFFRGAMIRYALEGDPKVFWQLGKNRTFVKRNYGVLASIYLGQKTLWLVFLLCSGLLVLTGPLALLIPVTLRPLRLVASGLLYVKGQSKAPSLKGYFPQG